MNSLPTLKIEQIKSKESFDHQTIISALDTTLGDQNKIHHNKMSVRQYPLSNSVLKNIHKSSNRLSRFTGETSDRTLSITSKRQYFKIQPQDEIDEVDKLKDKELIDKLDQSFESPFYDQKAKDLIGEQAPSNFFKCYKKLDRVKEQNKYASLQDSVQTSMLSQAEKLNLIPCKVGVIKSAGDRNLLTIPKQKYGDRYAEVITEGLRNLPAVTDFYLSQNRLTSDSVTKLVDSISKHARLLDLDYNKVGRIGCDAISMQLTQRDCHIEVLNLEDNQLGNIAVINLCKAISQSQVLKRLNLSKNFLTNACVDALQETLQKCQSLQELYLHWNQIRFQGGQQIFEVLTNDCENLVVLDFSFNLLGSIGSQVSILIPQLAEFFKHNKTLLHLDLSANGFGLAECEQIEKSIKVNRTIYGFHFSGNYGFVDSRGFIVLEEQDQKERNYQELQVQRRMNGFEPIKRAYSTAEKLEKSKDACWICDGWYPYTFCWKGDSESDPVFMHCNIECYEGIYLGKANQNGEYKSRRMVPPGDILYLFNCNEQFCLNTNTIVIQHHLKQKIKLQDRQIDCNVQEVNLTQSLTCNRVIDEYFCPTVDVLPRTPDEVYIPAKRKKAKRVWTYPISIWAKKYKFESTEAFRNAFEEDWKNSKITKYVKSIDEQKILMDMCWENYKSIRETYKYYSALSPQGDVFSISQNNIAEFCNACNLIDGKTLKLSDVDFTFIATNSASQVDWKGNPRNPDRGLVRYQMMEFLVRIASDKFIRNSQTPPTNSAALQMLLDQCLPHMLQFDSHKWRMERYYIEQCDDVCKKYKWLFDYLYTRYSSKKVKPGQQPFMCMDELKEIFQRASLYDENFVERDVNIAFNLGMMAQVDELDKDRIFQMSWIEFMEAVARIADKVSLPIIGRENEEWNIEKRMAQPLYYKFESLLCHLEKYHCDDETKKNNPIPGTSMFDIIEEDEYY